MTLLGTLPIALEEVDSETLLLPSALATKYEIDLIYTILQRFPGAINLILTKAYRKEEMPKRKKNLARKIKIL